MLDEHSTYPYRPCVGILLLNQKRHVWIGHRISKNLPDETLKWQFPQGGIHKNETPDQAVYRELAEETGITQAKIIYELPYWLTYDFPVSVRKKVFEGKFRGQIQKWFALEFKGQDKTINLTTNERPEFDDWTWRSLQECPNLVVSFKRPIYIELVKKFSYFISQ